LQSKIILLHFYSWVTSLLFDNMFPEFTLFSSLFYRFLIRNWGVKCYSRFCLKHKGSAQTLGSRKIDCKQTHYTTFSIKSWIPVSATRMTPFSKVYLTFSL
ncbi:MAG: hypothetical protein ACR5LA_12815, partial [Wolbachia sp.]